MVKAKPKQATELTTGGSALEFRKTNEAIGLRVSEGRLSLLSRKTFNLMVYHAQKLGVPGQNAPLDTPVAQKYFWIPLTDLARDAAYDSKDTELLKKSVQELQDIRIYMEDEKQWTSERLVSSVKIVNSAGLKRRGGRVWFGFAFPPEVANLVMNPGAYTKLSIYYQTMLRSGASLALYEICRRFATNPSRLSSRERWEWWYGALSGNPVTEGLPQYKYFKRDVLKTSISEINAVTDIEVELVEHKQGRKVVDLQFRIRLNEQPALDLPAPPLIDAAMIERLMQLGIAQEEATAIFVSHDDATLAGDARPGRGARAQHQGAAARFAGRLFQVRLAQSLCIAARRRPQDAGDDGDSHRGRGYPRGRTWPDAAGTVCRQAFPRGDRLFQRDRSPAA